MAGAETVPWRALQDGEGGQGGGSGPERIIAVSSKRRCCCPRLFLAQCGVPTAELDGRVTGRKRTDKLSLAQTGCFLCKHKVIERTALATCPTTRI
jgi:hypothetical protein